jgi:hypothetical protein
MDPPWCCSHGTGWWHIGVILGIIFVATAVLEFFFPLSSSGMEAVILSFVYGRHKQALRIFKEEHTTWWNPNVKNPEVYEAGNCYVWWRWLSATECATAAEGLWSFGFAVFFTVWDCECDLSLKEEYVHVGV